MPPSAGTPVSTGRSRPWPARLPGCARGAASSSGSQARWAGCSARARTSTRPMTAVWCRWTTAAGRLRGGVPVGGRAAAPHGHRRTRLRPGRHAGCLGRGDRVRAPRPQLARPAIGLSGRLPWLAGRRAAGCRDGSGTASAGGTYHARTSPWPRGHAGPEPPAVGGRQAGLQRRHDDQGDGPAPGEDGGHQPVAGFERGRRGAKFPAHLIRLTGVHMVYWTHAPPGG